MKTSFFFPAVLHLTTQKLLLYLLAPALVAIVVQLAIGSSILVLMLVMVTVAAGFLGFAVLGIYNIGAWLALCYVLSNVLIALYAKTIMWQTLNSHLYSPLMSFAVLAVTTSSLFVALIIVRRIPVGGSLLTKTSNLHTLAWVSWGSFIIGIIAWVLNHHFDKPGGAGFGGLAVFIYLLYMGIIARTAMILESSNNQRAFDFKLAIIIAIAVLLGLLSNSKMNTAYPVVIYFITVFFYRRNLPWHQVAMFIVGGILFVVFLAPLVQAWRSLGQQKMTVSTNINFMAQSVESLLVNGDINHFEGLARNQFRGGYYNYYGTNGREQMLLGRFSSVQQIDPIIAQVNKQGIIGGSVVWSSLVRLLPRFIYPNKPRYFNSYHIVVDLGLITPAGGKYPTVPLAGQVYAGYGMAGVFVIPFLTFLIFLLLLKKLGWNLYRNIYAIYFFVVFVFIGAGQDSFGQFTGSALRGLPLFTIVFWILVEVSRVQWREVLRR